MTPSSNLQRRVKAAGLLLGILLVLLFTAQSLRTTVQDMDQTVASLYADRVQPAVDLVHLSESLHAKRLLLENQFVNELPVSPAILAGQLKHYNLQIKERLNQYEKTKLTTSETRWLMAFKQKWMEGQDIEKSIQQLIIAKQQPVARQIFYKQGALVFKHSVQALRELAQIQVETGQTSVKFSHQIAAGGALNTTLLTAISVVIGLLTMSLLDGVMLPDRKKQPLPFS